MLRRAVAAGWPGGASVEVHGMPVGMSMPQALPFDFGSAQTGCDFGPCAGMGASGFSGPGTWAGYDASGLQGLARFMGAWHSTVGCVEEAAAKVVVTATAVGAVAGHVAAITAVTAAGCGGDGPIALGTCLPAVVADAGLLAGLATSA